MDDHIIEFDYAKKYTLLNSQTWTTRVILPNSKTELLTLEKLIT